MRSVESMPAELERNHRRVELAGVASDAVDGVTRLLTDVAKFGLLFGSYTSCRTIAVTRPSE